MDGPDLVGEVQGAHGIEEDAVEESDAVWVVADETFRERPFSSFPMNVVNSTMAQIPPTVKQPKMKNLRVQMKKNDLKDN